MVKTMNIYNIYCYNNTIIYVLFFANAKIKSTYSYATILK